MNGTNALLSDFPRAHHWPVAIRRAFFKSHMNNSERFKVTVFFLANGVAPYVIKNCYAHKFNFDASAWRQINWIINQYPTSNWTAWNIALQRSV